MPVLKQGSSGPDVTNLQATLKELGFDPNGVDGNFGPGTKAAVIAFQTSKGMSADGIAGPQIMAALQSSVGGADPSTASTTSTAGVPNVTVAQVSQMFPGTPVANIQTNLPFVLQALNDAGLGDKDMIVMALATIRAETASFRPISEGISKFNTTPGSHPFNLYDNKGQGSLGNQGAPDGERFKGRGFVQLTGRANYKQHGTAIGLGTQLIENPDLANQPDIAAKLLASFIKNKEQAIRNALSSNDLALARKLVNGGRHGLPEFTQAYQTGMRVIS